MKTHTFTPRLLSLCAAAAIGLAAVCGPAAAASVYLPSVLAGDSVADRTIVIAPGTASVNVTYGETVRFVAPGGRDFVLRIDSVGESFSLNAVAPAGALERPVTAYVAIAGTLRGS